MSEETRPDDPNEAVSTEETADSGPPFRRRRPRPIFIGLLMILIGAMFLFDELDFVDFMWQGMLIITGIAFLAEAWFEKNKGTVFVGCLLFLLGLVFLGDEFRWFDSWPALLYAVGFAFLISSAVKGFKDTSWVPGGIILVLAVVFTVEEYHVFRWRYVDSIFDLWPIAMIAIGVYLIVRRK